MQEIRDIRGTREIRESREIVVGTDLSEDAGKALSWAVDEARRDGATVRVVFAWSVERCPRVLASHVPSHNADDLAAAAEKLLHEAIERNRATAPAVTITGRPVRADPVEALLNTAANAQMLVIGARGSGRLRRLVTGSVSDACVHMSAGAVVVVRWAPEQGRGHERRNGQVITAPREKRPVLVGVDGSDGSINALRWAATAAAQRGVALRVLHVWMPAPAMYTGYYAGFEGEGLEKAAQALLEDTLVKGLGGRTDVRVDAGLMLGAAGTTLIRQAAGAQLLVVGARGHEGFAELLLGSTSQRCTHHSPCPVAVIHGGDRRQHR
ncbi:universal stress protein [Frankia sp. CiP1_Cm_nod1]|uniref:universal stress protein n=1 Tax=Frankia sp. CiP1_Cm_nod1 TaxID=2897160 RepID=UPI00202436D4